LFPIHTQHINVFLSLLIKTLHIFLCLVHLSTRRHGPHSARRVSAANSFSFSHYFLSPSFCVASSLCAIVRPSAVSLTRQRRTAVSFFLSFFSRIYYIVYTYTPDNKIPQRLWKSAAYIATALRGRAETTRREGDGRRGSNTGREGGGGGGGIGGGKPRSGARALINIHVP